ncbi:DUF6064 family protein [Hydrogenophaga palleronii]|uniref:DUF6064 family protein n=1 Tax=Hydrogenophaga palleronii TaxID=65655 RepID=UPI00082617A9|nr:DUF6064 family protein [Hydrogenophaga palleronii]
MSEWWTYRPADFLMFAPRTYWRLFELQNSALWPAPGLCVLLGLVLFAFLCPGRRGRPLRAGALAFAIAWAWVAYSFLWQRYAPINWAASTAAWLFGLQALGLLVLSFQHPVQATASALRHRIGLALLLWALLVHPLLAMASGRPWMQAEVVGLAPDPTAIATLGLLLCADAAPRAVRALLALLRAGAMAWLLASAATLATMGSVQAAGPLAAVLLAGLALARQQRG